jgi:hypothetical protein
MEVLASLLLVLLGFVISVILSLLGAHLAGTWGAALGLILGGGIGFLLVMRFAGR